MELSLFKIGHKFSKSKISIDVNGVVTVWKMDIKVFLWFQNSTDNK